MRNFFTGRSYEYVSKRKMQLLQALQHNKEFKIQKFNMLKDEVFIQVALSSQPLYPKSHDSGKLQLIAGKTIIASQNH